MTDEKIKINALIKQYKGDNAFLLSLKKRLNSKYVTKIEYNGKLVSTLSDSQYEFAKVALKL